MTTSVFDIDLNGLSAALLDAVHEVGLTGAVDILLMSVLVYLGLAWLKRSQATGILQGVLILGLLYLVGRQFNLFLTTVVLEAFFAVLLVALVVIFRDQLRRSFEGVARWGFGARTWRRKAVTAAPRVAEMLARALGDLAKARIGALVVLGGEEALDAHISEGVLLNGRLSEALLKSLFDPHSDGHDGAALIEDGLITRFGCHLPLSTSVGRFGHRGTRHAAALGLSERTDAMCVVVSEERGTISVAKDGELHTLRQPEEVVDLLKEFTGETPRPRQPFTHLITKHYGLKMAALAISCLLWVVLVHGAKQTIRRFAVPIEPSGVPQGQQVASITPAEVTVTLAGARRDFYLFRRRSVRLTLRLSDLRAGVNQRAIRATDVEFPRALTLRDIRPADIAISIQPRPAQQASSRSADPEP